MAHPGYACFKQIASEPSRPPAPPSVHDGTKRLRGEQFYTDASWPIPLDAATSVGAGGGCNDQNPARPSSSLMKNLKSSAFVLRFSSSYKRSVRFGSECSRLVATLSL